VLVAKAGHVASLLARSALLAVSAAAAVAVLVREPCHMWVAVKVNTSRRRPTSMLVAEVISMLSVPEEISLASSRAVVF